MNKIYKISRKAILLISISLLLILSACTNYTDYSVQIEKYNDLVQRYNNLLSETQNLSADNDRLKAELEEAIIPPYILVKGRNVVLTFRNLDSNLEKWQFDTVGLESSAMLGQLMREIDIQNLKYVGLEDVANRFNDGSKYIRFTGQGNFLDFRPYIMTDPFQNMAQSFFTRHTDDESKVREVWNMVTQLNQYINEAIDTPRLPLETLLLGGGDCEDLAILTASILREMSSTWKIEFVYMDSDNPSSLKTINHVTIFVDTGTYKTYVESTDKEIMNPFQTVEGFRISIP